MGRGRQRAGSIASTNGSFCTAERGAVEPEEEPNQYCALPGRHGPKGHAGKVGKGRHPTSPNCLPPFPPTNFAVDLLHPQPAFRPARWGTRALAEPPRTVPAHTSPCTRDTPLTGVHVRAAKLTAVAQPVRGMRGGGGRFLKYRSSLPAKEMAAGWKARR